MEYNNKDTCKNKGIATADGGCFWLCPIIKPIFGGERCGQKGADADPRTGYDDDDDDDDSRLLDAGVVVSNRVVKGCAHSLATIYSAPAAASASAVTHATVRSCG